MSRCKQVCLLAVQESSTGVVVRQGSHQSQCRRCRLMQAFFPFKFNHSMYFQMMSDQPVFFLSVCYSLGSPAEHLHQISIYHIFQSVAFNFECLFLYRSWKNCEYIYTFINKHNPPPERIIPKAK